MKGKKKMKKLQKGLAMFLCLVMCLSMFPAQALAEEDEQEEIDENGLWLEADRKGEEEWAERYLTSLENSRFCMN